MGELLVFARLILLEKGSRVFNIPAVPFILCHFIGDYILQSSWMAEEKTKRWLPAIIHAGTYLIPFILVFRPSASALFVMGVTHAVIDHLRLARHISFAKAFLAPPSAWPRWEDCRATGYHKDTPAFLAVWLMIVVDNTVHNVINLACLLYL